MHVHAIARFPVKGLSPEAMAEARLSPGEAIPWDRAFALAQGDSGFDPAHPAWRPKQNFLCLMANARAARLRSRFDPASGRLRIAAPGSAPGDAPGSAPEDAPEDAVEADARDPAGRAAIAAFLARFMGEEARGTPVFHHVPGHVFGDQRRPVVSLLSLASLAAYEADIGARRDVRRFRANIVLEGGAPWAEEGWVGRELRLGTARLRVSRPTTRCPATQVNPDTAQRDADPAAELRARYGHINLGVHAEVVEGGVVRVGDELEVMRG